MKYKNGRQIPALVIESLRFVSKVGAMTRQTWYEHFSTGTKRWKQKQLSNLISLGIYKPHTTQTIDGSVVIDDYGRGLAKELNWPYVNSSQAEFIKHDETLAIGLWKIEKAGLFPKWMTYKELRNQELTPHLLKLGSSENKYPDAIAKFQGMVNSKVVAIEYENDRKSNWRFNKLMQAYQGTKHYEFILFIAETPLTELIIKRSMSYLKDDELNSKIGFMNVEDWKSNPLSGEIRGLKLGRSLQECAEKM
jgi:hypothetical protein